MQTHTPSRKEIRDVMNSFIQPEGVQEEPVQKYVHWATLFMAFMLCSSINVFTVAWLKIHYRDLILTDHLLLGAGLVEAGLIAFFAYQTPLRKYFTKSTGRIKWE